MKKEKILINIENLSDIVTYKKIGVNNFLFAVDYFSIGLKSFNLDTLKSLKIDCNKILYMNRVLNNEDVEKLKGIKNDLASFKYIIFEDIAVYNILKDTDIKLIWNQAHFATNYCSINYWLEYVDSAIISNEITREEITEILNKTNKPLVLNVFGLNGAMYSRRTLLTNFNSNFNLLENKKVILKEKISCQNFLAIENKFGTILFNNEFFNIANYLQYFDDKKILFYLLFPFNRNVNEIIKYIQNYEIDNANEGFMNKKTFYKLGDFK